MNWSIFTAKVSLLFALAVASVQATMLNVKAGGGGNYTTIQACANAMANGDTCVVYSGTYNENVTVSAGGVGAYKAFTVNPGDTVYVLSFTLSSHNKVDGFHIQNPASPSNGPCVSLGSNITDVFITNNNLYACGAYMIKEPASSNDTYVYIQGNTLSYSCSTSNAPNPCTAVQLVGDHQLIENNDISHVSDGYYAFGKWLVFRNNKFHDTPASECGSNSGNCHIDFSQHEGSGPGGPQLPTEYLLFEGNSSYNMIGSNEHAGPLFQAESCGGNCFNAIFRFHTAYHVGGGGITDDNSFVTPSAPNSPAWINVKAYNNDWIDMDMGALSGGMGINPHSHGSYGGSNVNEIYYFTGAISGGGNTYYCEDTACSPYAYGHTIAYATGGGTIYGHNYGSGAFTSDPGNVIADPKFLNYAGNDFHLTAASPGIGAGTSLTTVASGDSGSGTTLVVNDASYFQDGYGLTGVHPDWIRVGPTTAVQIVSINYNTNTLTLASSIIRSPGDPIYLFKNSSGQQVLFGANPDIGSFPSSTSTPSTCRDACDVNCDNADNVGDVQSEINMVLGKAACTNPSGTCNVTSVQKVINAALGRACVSP